MNVTSALTTSRAARFADPRLRLALLSAAVYCAATLLGAWALPHASAAPIQWSGAALVALFLLAPTAQWWTVVAAAVPAHFIAHLGSDASALQLMWQLLHHNALALSIAGGMRLVLGRRGAFENLPGLGVYICAAFLLPSTLAWTAPDVMLKAAHGDAGASAQWRATALADALALLALTPALYLWLAHGADWLRRFRVQRCVEALAIASVVWFIYVLVFIEQVGRPPALYLFFAPALWAAVRFGVVGAATVVAAIVLLASWSGLASPNALPGQSPDASLIDLQLFLVAIALTALILAVVMHERQRATRELHHSETRYRTIVESQTDLVCRNLPDTTLTFVNEAYCRFFRKTREQLIGTRWLELLPREVWDVVRERLDRLTPATPTLVHEHEVLLPDGSQGWQQWADVAFFDASGKLIEVQGIGRDVTELKRAERALRHSDERFRLVLQATNDVIFDWDIVRGTLWSSADGRWDDQDLGARPWNLDQWASDIHPEDRGRVVGDLDATLRGEGHEWEAEYRYSRRGGPMQHVHERGYILRAADGSAVRMIGALSNVNDRRRLEEAQRSLSRISGLATIGELNASIIHEVTQPLAAMLNNAEAGLMMLATGDERAASIRLILEDVRRDGERASEVIHSLRGFLRNQQVHYEALDLERTLQDALDLMRAECRRRGASVALKCACSAHVNGDRAHLQQVLLNLLTNSLDALVDAPPPRRRITVSVASPGAGRVRVSVHDAGAGIPPDRLSTVFESFVTNKRHGMGLGLAIARSIIQAHGGRIWAENNSDGPGATVHFELASAAQNAVDPAA